MQNLLRKHEKDVEKHERNEVERRALIDKTTVANVDDDKARKPHIKNKDNEINDFIIEVKTLENDVKVLKAIKDDKETETKDDNEKETNATERKKQQTQISVLSIDDDNSESFEYEGERVRVFIPPASTILPDKEGLKQAYNTVLKITVQLGNGKHDKGAWDMVANVGSETMRHFISIKGINCGRWQFSPGTLALVACGTPVPL